MKLLIISLLFFNQVEAKEVVELVKYNKDRFVFRTQNKKEIKVKLYCVILDKPNNKELISFIKYKTDKKVFVISQKNKEEYQVFINGVDDLSRSLIEWGIAKTNCQEYLPSQELAQKRKEGIWKNK